MVRMLSSAGFDDGSFVDRNSHFINLCRSNPRAARRHQWQSGLQYLHMRTCTVSCSRQNLPAGKTLKPGTPINLDISRVGFWVGR